MKQDQDSSQLQLLLNNIRLVDESLIQQDVPKRVILLMGQTKAGKTTLFYYLHGKRLLWQKNQIQVWQLKPQSNYMNAYIGDGYESTTVYPNIPPLESQDDAMVIDMPGFDDNRHHYRLINIYILLQTLKLLKEVHICHVIPEQCIESNSLIQEFTKITTLFNKRLIFTKNCLSFIITKVENQDIKQIFLAQINDLIESNLVESIKDQLEAFKEKKIFQFHNKQAFIEEGLQLRKNIEIENSFFETNHKPQQILSHKYAQEMIGRSNLIDFSDYLIKIVEDINRVLEPLLHLCANIIVYQLQTILELSHHQIEQVKEAIAHNTSAITLYQLNKLGFQQSQACPPSQSHYIIFFTCLKDEGLLKGKQNLYTTLHSFSCVLLYMIKSKGLLQQNYLRKVHNILKEMGSLIAIIMQVHLQQIKQAIGKTIVNQNFFSILSSFNKSLANKQHSIINSKQFSKHSDNEEIVQLMKELNISTQEQHIIEKVYRYALPLSYKQIEEHKFKYKARTKAIKTPLNDQQSIQELAVSVESLRYLVNTLRQSKEGESIKQILNKISQIFYWFSQFQQAIMFKMAIVDQNGIRFLIEEAICCHGVSGQFIRDILVPYYCKINCDCGLIETLYNYLSCICQTVEQKQGVEAQRTECLIYMWEHPEDYYLMMDRYKPLEFYFVDSILQHFEYYLYRIEIKQQQLRGSSVSSFTSFITTK